METLADGNYTIIDGWVEDNNLPNHEEHLVLRAFLCSQFERPKEQRKWLSKTYSIEKSKDSDT